MKQGKRGGFYRKGLRHEKTGQKIGSPLFIVGNIIIYEVISGNFHLLQLPLSPSHQLCDKNQASHPLKFFFHH